MAAPQIPVDQAVEKKKIKGTTKAQRPKGKPQPTD
jgi:hypothetical protein